MPLLCLSVRKWIISKWVEPQLTWVLSMLCAGLKTFLISFSFGWWCFYTRYTFHATPITLVLFFSERQFTTHLLLLSREPFWFWHWCLRVSLCMYLRLWNCKARPPAWRPISTGSMKMLTRLLHLFRQSQTHSIVSYNLAQYPRASLHWVVPVLRTLKRPCNGCVSIKAFALSHRSWQCAAPHTSNMSSASEILITNLLLQTEKEKLTCRDRFPAYMTNIAMMLLMVSGPALLLSHSLYFC